MVLVSFDNFKKRFYLSLIAKAKPIQIKKEIVTAQFLKSARTVDRQQW